jgi:hypothetical protein
MAEYIFICGTIPIQTDTGADVIFKNFHRKIQSFPKSLMLKTEVGAPLF